MTKTWNLTDLDFSKAKEYISSQDPDVSLRYALPVPNWLDNGEPTFQHENIQPIQKGTESQWKFKFTNYKDNAQQAVKIDGKNGIVFMGVTPDTAKQLDTLINDVTQGEDLTPDMLDEILKRSYEELGISDRFNKGLESFQKFFHPFDVNGQQGAYLPKPNPSSAIYIPGAGEFADGPTVTPQKFEDGAFINFPGVRLKDLFAQKAELRGRLVQASVFSKDRTNPDGSAIDLETLDT